MHIEACVLVLTLSGLATGGACSRQKIVGGVMASVGDHPYVMQLEFAGRMICGATLVTDSWLLTAGHCCKDNRSYLYKVRGGTSQRGSGGFVLPIRQVVLHENFFEYSGGVTDTYSTPFFIHNDICLLRLLDHVGKHHMEPAILMESRPPTHTMVKVLGWGRVQEGGWQSIVLNEVTVPILPAAVCTGVYHVLPERVFCAGLEEGGKDSCHGDSGGPALVGNVLVGVVSFGNGCARSGFPGIYTSVPFYKKWILDKIKALE